MMDGAVSQPPAGPLQDAPLGYSTAKPICEIGDKSPCTLPYRHAAVPQETASFFSAFCHLSNGTHLLGFAAGDL